MIMDKHWRWNSNYAWHYFSSMKYEEALVAATKSEFMRYHHLRSCIFFSVACVETFLNVKMKDFMGKNGSSDEEVLKEIKIRKLKDKLKKWPKAISGKDIKIPLEIKSTIDIYEDLRHDIVHVKPLDHSFYLKLDDVEPEAITDAVARLMVTVHSSLDEEFPYWLLGWNYIGLNGSLAQVMEMNNYNSFMYSLRNLGFRLNGSVTPQEWIKRAMVNIKGYEMLKQALDGLEVDIEPEIPRFPHMPRLTRKWWAYQ
ncbi:hypothetical protein HOP54_08755 [Halomonas daqingensis]|uniref:hypothetical protein n=1 Tax=Billgrantia desiderata TaxID=52021 RepID=UPI001F3D7F2B|nr:hypothetical protein [Halomonas desiderata]MCE8028777.1 hypothetical protein [Halomonas desiderata]